MKILAIEKETPETTDEQFVPFLRQEANRVWELCKSGVIRELYFRRDRQEAVLIMECLVVSHFESSNKRARSSIFHKR